MTNQPTREIAASRHRRAGHALAQVLASIPYEAYKLLDAAAVEVALAEAAAGVYEPELARVRAEALRDFAEQMRVRAEEAPADEPARWPWSGFALAAFHAEEHAAAPAEPAVGPRTDGAASREIPDRLAEFGATLTEDERQAWLDTMAAQRIPDPAVEELATELAEERTLHRQTIAQRDRLLDRLRKGHDWAKGLGDWVLADESKPCWCPTGEHPHTSRGCDIPGCGCQWVPLEISETGKG